MDLDIEASIRKIKNYEIKVSTLCSLPNYKKMDSFLLSFMATILLLPGAAAEVGTGHMGNIGVIVDNSSRIGKEEIVAMKLAIHDFNNKSNRQLDFHVRDSQSDPVLTLLSGKLHQSNYLSVIRRKLNLKMYSIINLNEFCF